MKFDIKICGLSNYEDALLAHELGADHLGFVLFRKSPRAITPAKLEAIVSRLPDGFKAIGVFVNHSRKEVEQISSRCGLYAAQLHGDEKAGDFENLPVPIWRAIRTKGGKFVPALAEWGIATRYVVDAAVKGKYGGTGREADWSVARKLSVKYPVMLAGGLTPGNVIAAIRAVKPMGVDVVSGVESSPGRKDRAKMEGFIRLVKAANSALSAG